MTEERFEKNRIIAEWLGWKPNENRTRWHSPSCQQGGGNCGGKVPDFYTSEEANAMVRRKIRETIPYMVLHRENGQEVVRIVPKAVDPIIRGTGATEMEAICDAALNLIGESPKEHA